MKRERRPKINPDFSNRAEVCDYYENHGPNERFLRIYHNVMDKICEPRTVFAPGVEEEISEHLSSGDPTVIAMTHHSFSDPMNIGAVINEQEALRPIIGTTIIPGKLTYFNKFLFGTIIALGGAKPVYREEDLIKYYKKQGLSDAEIAEKLEATSEDRKGSNKKLRQIEARMVDDGYIYAIYSEGTRNRGDQSKVQTVRNGVKYLLENIENREKAKIICVGYDYGGGRLMKRFLNPTMYIDLIDAPPADEVNDRLSEALQGCIDGAIANRHEPYMTPVEKAGLSVLSLGAVAIAHELIKI